MAQAPATRIARDEHGDRTLYEDIEIGRDLGVLEWTVDEAALEKQCAIDFDYDPAYFLDVEFGTRVAPPQIQYRPPRWLISRTYNIRGVFYRWEMENLAPIRPGVPLRIHGTVADKWIKNDREFVEFAFTALDPDGQEIFRTRRVHVLDVISRDAPRAGEGIDSGHKPEKI